MTALYEFHQHPDLDSPVLILGLDGWIDAGMAAAGAMSTLLTNHDTDLVATFDTDLLLDHRARRPTVRLIDGIVEELRWPTLELHAATDRNGAGMLLLSGAEPDHQWHAFTDTVETLALELGVSMVVGLGAYPAPAPHTRPVLLSCTASTETLAEQIGFVRGSLEVPAGVQAAIEQRAHEAGIPAVGMWSQVPHYAAAMPYPAASLALLEGLHQLAGLDLEVGDLPREAAASTDRITELISDNAEHAAMVKALEAQVDSMAQAEPLPSGDELAAELERFLRDQRPPDTP